MQHSIHFIIFKIYKLRIHVLISIIFLSLKFNLQFQQTKPNYAFSETVPSTKTDLPEAYPNIQKQGQALAGLNTKFKKKKIHNFRLQPGQWTIQQLYCSGINKALHTMTDLSNIQRSKHFLKEKDKIPEIWCLIFPVFWYAMIAFYIHLLDKIQRLFNCITATHDPSVTVF